MFSLFIIPLFCAFVYAQSAVTAPAFQPCPILGPRFPIATDLSHSDPLTSALENLTAVLDSNKIPDDDSDAQIVPSTTSFSLALFSAENAGNPSSFLYQYHRTAPSNRKGPCNSTTVDENTIYPIGPLTQIFTAWSFLIGIGERHWGDAITDYLPELGYSCATDQAAEATSLDCVAWCDVTLGDLAGHMAGIARDVQIDPSLNGEASNLLLQAFPESSNRSETGPRTPSTEADFLNRLAQLATVYLPSSTPILSDTGFQILALAIERHVQADFGTFVQDGILKKLNLTSTSLGQPLNDSTGVLQCDQALRSWATGGENGTFLAASTGMFSSIADLARAGSAILASTLLPSVSTRRWLKPISSTSNLRNAVGRPWNEIYHSTLDNTPTSAVVDIYTHLGSSGNFSTYLGLVPDYNVGFVVLAVDIIAAPDLNAMADIVSTFALPALEKTAALQADGAYGGNYASTRNQSSFSLSISATDGLPGLTLTQWTHNGVDVRAAYARLNGLNALSLSFRLYPTNLVAEVGAGSKRAFRAVLQDMNASADAGTPTCVSWMDVDALHFGGRGLDEFVFELDSGGEAVNVEVPALSVTMRKA